ncbi:MAG: hypothetical protein WCK78_19720 [Paludibacter sp.]
MNKIDELSISDLKAAYDFVKIDLADLEESAVRKGIQPESIPAYSEVKQLEDKLYSKLLTITSLIV